MTIFDFHSIGELECCASGMASMCAANGGRKAISTDGVALRNGRCLQLRNPHIVAVLALGDSEEEPFGCLGFERFTTAPTARLEVAFPAFPRRYPHKGGTSTTLPSRRGLASRVVLLGGESGNRGTTLTALFQARIEPKNRLKNISLSKLPRSKPVFGARHTQQNCVRKLSCATCGNNSVAMRRSPQAGYGPFLTGRP